MIIATPTNYNDKGQFIDTSAVEDAIEQTLAVNHEVMMVIKSTVPVGYTNLVREKYGIDNLIFSPEFLRESKAFYDNLHPSMIVVGAYDHQKEAAKLLRICSLKVLALKRSEQALNLRTSRCS